MWQLAFTLPDIKLKLQSIALNRDVIASFTSPLFFFFPQGSRHGWIQAFLETILSFSEGIKKYK